jgi:hypothetical protein
MSTTTTTARVARPPAATSALATSAKFKAFATVFSISGPVVYCIIQYFNLPLVTYWPASNRLIFGWGPAMPGEGPNMLWYGWTLSVILISAALGLIAMMLPERTVNRIPLSLLWILPILAIPYVIYSLMPWWTLAAGQ